MSKHWQKCVLCESDRITPLKRYESCELMNCRKCGFVFQSKIPTAKELRDLYEPNDEYVYGVDSFISEVTIKRYHELLDRFESFRLHNTILDVGCGVGYFLEVAKYRGWDVYGTEFSKKAIQKCTDKGIAMQQGQLDTSNYKLSSFDIVVSFEVLEHISDPNEDIGAISSLLRPGGIAYITTPNFNAASRKITGADWDKILYPDHLCYYTKRSISAMFKKHPFHPIKIETTGINISNLNFKFQKINGEPKTADSGSQASGYDDEAFRENIEKHKSLQAVKYLANYFLNQFGIGDALKATFQKK